MTPLLAEITMTFPGLLVLLGIVMLFLAALNVPGFTRWSWFPGGVLLIAVAYFVTISS